MALLACNGNTLCPFGCFDSQAWVPPVDHVAPLAGGQTGAINLVGMKERFGSKLDGVGPVDNRPSTD